MENIFFTAYSNHERHAVLNEITSVISKYGHVVDFTLFSDISVSMKIEIEECKVDELHNELNSHLKIEKFDYLHSLSKKERTIYLNITFNKGIGNLLIEVPSVPG